MLSVLLFFLLSFLVLSSGCVFAAARWGLRYEEALPLSMTSMMLFLFAAALLNLLESGVWALCIAAPLLYVAAAKLSAGHLRRLRETLLTPAALLFLLSFAALFYFNYGHSPHRIDEMTHWADSVKIMYYFGTLYSAAGVPVSFPSYPPGMGLLELFFLRLYDLVCGRRVYAEWVMYIAYQSFMLSFLFPFLRALDFRRPLRSMTAFALVVLCPLMMDESAPYGSLYIDPLICAVFGGGLAAVFTEPRKDRPVYELYVFAACAVLVLVKPTGLLLAAFLAGVYAAELLLRGGSRRGRRVRLAALLGSVLLPLGLWTLRKRIDGVTQSFSSKEGSVDLRLLLRLALHREGESWQQIVHDNYYEHLFANTVRIKGFACPYWLLGLFCALSLFLLVCLMCRREKSLYTARPLVLPALLVIAVVYFVGMCYAYIFKFSWWEAIILASLNRYIGVILYTFYTAALLALVRFFTETELGAAPLCAALAVLLLLSPFGRAMDVVKRTAVDSSNPVLREFRAAAELLNADTGGIPARVDVISQGSLGEYYYELRYIMRPNVIVPYGEWFLGPSPGICWEGELPDRLVSAEQWQEELREAYDYVYLLRADDYFRAQYGDLFAEDSAPEGQGLYRFDGAQLHRVG